MGSKVTVANSARWVRICQSCWQALYPNDYVPQLTDFDTCASCGHTELVLSVTPDVVQQAAALVIRPPLCNVHVPTVQPKEAQS